MKKTDIARRMARQSGVSQAEAETDWIRWSIGFCRTCVKEKRPTCRVSGSSYPVQTGSSGWSGSTRVSHEHKRFRVACQVAQIVLRGIAAGKEVEIDGLGVFYPDPLLGFRFEPSTLPQVFLAYGKEDQHTVCRLYDALEAAGFAPWMDVRKLLPGQNWPRAIESAIETSDFFIACFSGRSVVQEGRFSGRDPLYARVRPAGAARRNLPGSGTARRCLVPRTIEKQYQYVDLFPNWERGAARVMQAMRRELERRRAT